MREIKFRAWEDDAKFFVYFTMGDLLFGSEGFGISSGLDRIKSMLEETSKNPSSDERIQQYTGLKDKNGKEIYEGDIVREYVECEFDGKIDIATDENFVVEWYSRDLDCGWNLCPVSCDGYEVIGNVYENPELLGGK